MNARGIAVGVSILFSSLCAILLLVWSGAVRYENELIISMPSLAGLTLAFAVAGFILALAVGAQVWIRRVKPEWFNFGLCGIAVSAVACVALAFVANCVMQCKGSHGSLIVGLSLAVPAGFAAGVACYWVWVLLQAILQAMTQPRAQ